MVRLEVRGAREHNLRGVDLVLPREQLVVLCGVSGSGKSSLAFDTLHAEGQRRYLEALDLQRRGGLPMLQPPQIDHIAGLPPTVALAQQAPAPGPRATVATVGDVAPVLRVLFARAGTLHCPQCDDAVVPRTHDEIVAELSALPEGTRLLVEAPLRASEPAAVLDEVERAGFSRLRIDDEVVRLDALHPKRLEGARVVRVVVDRVKLAPDRRARLFDSVRLAAKVGGGVVVAVVDGRSTAYVDRPLCVRDGLELPWLTPRLLTWQSDPGACPDCGGVGLDERGAPCPGCDGSRLSPVAGRVRWRGERLSEVLSRTVGEASDQLEAVGDLDAVEAATVPDLRRRLARLVDLGLDDLSLSRGAARVSDGELRRLRLARQVSAPLSGVLYVLDEPAAGLDPERVDAVVTLLRELVDAGNTVVAVEHHPAVIRAADHVVEFGPGAGVDGGRVVYEGTVDGLLGAETATGAWLSGRQHLVARTAEPIGTVAVRGARHLGLQGLDVDLPLGVVTAITGPSGSGKSALLELVAGWLREAEPRPVADAIDGLDALTRAVVVDRSAGRSSRSNPATFTGAWDILRELLAATREARLRGLSPSAFSTNVKGGRCEACKGSGERRIALDLLPDVFVPCPVCDGRRFAGDVLEVRWKGSNASELLALTASEARPLLSGHPRLEAILRALERVGLGYLPLGQPAHTLSGGEARRLHLARELARADRLGAHDTAYLLDEPTAGLHPADVQRLLALLRELAEEGGTVWVATSDPALAAACDRTIHLSGK